MLTSLIVAKSERLHAWLALNEFRHSSSCTVWTWSDIGVVLDLALRQPIIRLAQNLFKLARGASIGDHLSKAIASAVLAFEELKACRAVELMAAAAAYLPSKTLNPKP